VDAYGIPRHGFDIILKRMQQATEAMKGHGPVWLVPQAFGFSIYCRENEPSETTGRAPPTMSCAHSNGWASAWGRRECFGTPPNVQGGHTRYHWPIMWKDCGLRRSSWPRSMTYW